MKIIMALYAIGVFCQEHSELSLFGQCCGSAARPEASLLADGIGCCIRMVVRRAAPSSLRMIIRSIVEAARGLDNK